MRVDRLTDVDPEAAASFTSIYEASFPPEERLDTGALLASVARGERWTWGARSGGHLVGIAVVLELPGVEVALLEYLAVDPARRSGGIGSDLLAAMLMDLRSARPDLAAVVLEVEAPGAASGDVRRQRERRVKFYRANGARPVETGGAYRVPSLSGSGTLRFDLLALPLGDPEARVDGALLGRCVEAILRGSYGCRAGDPLVAEVLAGLPR